MANQQNKQQQCEHTLQRGPNAGCRCATYTSFVNAQGRRLCSKHSARETKTTPKGTKTDKDRPIVLGGGVTRIHQLPAELITKILEYKRVGEQLRCTYLKTRGPNAGHCCNKVINKDSTYYSLCSRHRHALVGLHLYKHYI